jgi:aspartyl/asparaginyl beta-hydroxylase (cupin superfamily)
VVPDSDQCYITVNGETVYLKEGKCIVFDDSFYHEAENASLTQPRVVLIVDVWHPDLTEEEVCSSCLRYKILYFY